MARVRHGDDKLYLQDGWDVDLDDAGLLTGSCTLEGDEKYAYQAPQIGEVHPRDGRLHCSHSRIVHMKGGKIQCIAAYAGIISDPTPIKVEFPSGSGQDDIRTHPDFEKFAGTFAEPAPGAYFDPVTEEFVGFIDGDLVGVQSYIVPSFTVNLSYYSHSRPRLRKIGTIQTISAQFVIRPPEVKNFMLIGMPYREVSGLYFITEQFLGSGPKGWNPRIYGS